MSDKKPVRLSKAAREFNIGISTIAEFLEGQGIEIDAKPNTKLEPNVYEILVGEFQSEKTTKQEAIQVTETVKEVRETISIEDSRPKEEKAEVVEEETPAPKPAPAPAPTPKVEAPAPEAAPAPKEEAPAADETIRADVKNDMKVSVVGKIDLKNVDKSTKPKAKKEEAKEAPKAAPKKEEAKAAPVAEKAPDAKTEAPKKEAAPEKAASKAPEIETIKASAKKLAGPTVVGKIDLPVEKPRSKGKPKPVASTSDPESLRKKRKRKRIRQVDVKKEAGKPGTGNSRPIVGVKKKGGGAKPEVTEKDIQKEIKETLARLSGQGKNKAAKFRRAKREAVSARMDEEAARAEEEKSILKVTEWVTVSELANMMDVGVNEVIGACMSLGIMVSINARLDAETLTIIAEEFGFTLDFVSAEVQENIEQEEDDEADLEDRPPIITVMGHVDHGKTSLLDYVRRENVVAGEAGGITQHIGAYTVTLDSGKKITFLDTPGHEAFTAMRARGTKVTDVAIIIIAADDSVMPQTKEAISHAQAGGVPMIFAFNKVDKEGANPDRLREELSKMDILVEDWGGKYQSQEISAKKGTGIEELLEKVLLEAELLELKANPNKKAVGTVIESELDKGRGYVVTLLVEAGTLNVGDVVLAGQFVGKVKAMHNERGQNILIAGPSTPLSLLGLNGAPNAGDRFYVMEDEKEAKAIATKRQQLQREQGIRAQKHMTLEEIGRRLAIGDFQELNVIVKGDVDGSVEALSESLQKLSTESIQVNIIHKGVGQITESDVLLATASDAIIVGFQVRPSLNARKIAETEQIDIRLYSIIYKAIEEIKAAMEGMLSPDIEEKILGTAEVRDAFKITKVGMVAGCFVLEGLLKRNAPIRVIRDGIVIYDGDLGSLKRFKDDVKEVKKGFECGLNVDKFNDIKVGDQIESYEQVEVKKTL